MCIHHTCGGYGLSSQAEDKRLRKTLDTYFKVKALHEADDARKAEVAECVFNAHFSAQLLGRAILAINAGAKDCSEFNFKAGRGSRIVARADQRRSGAEGLCGGSGRPDQLWMRQEPYLGGFTWFVRSDWLLCVHGVPWRSLKSIEHRTSRSACTHRNSNACPNWTLGLYKAYA